MIIKPLLLTFLLILSSFAQDVKVASYNVENLFDLKYDGTEYKEYIPNTKSNWNKTIYNKKLFNISKVIKDMDANIVALQEIESKKALKDLLKHLPTYKYSSFIKNKQSAIGIAIISQYPISQTKKLQIDSNRKFIRPIQEVTITIKNKSILIFNNHWRSKRAAESHRIEYALSLQNYLKSLKKSSNYILIGDFNSNYNEFETFKNDKKLNDTYGITGINQVLNTTINKKFVTKNNILTFKKGVHYNLWLEKPYHKRFSSKFRQEKNTPDNILLSPSLFSNNNISYQNKSFKVFKPHYLYKNNKIQRWKTKGKNRVHQGVGYSDHLPIYATFSTTKKFHNEKSKIKKSITISELYDIDTLPNSLRLYNATVIYKHKNSAIIKQKNNRAIYIYNVAQNLKLGNSYDIDVSEIKTYNGLKEIVKIEKSFLKGMNKLSISKSENRIGHSDFRTFLYFNSLCIASTRLASALATNAL